MDKKPEVSVIFIHSNPLVYNTPGFSKMLGQMFDEYPIDVYIFDASQYFEIKEELKTIPNPVIVYPKDEILYRSLDKTVSISYATDSVSSVLKTIIHVGTFYTEPDTQELFKALDDKLFDD